MNEPRPPFKRRLDRLLSCVPTPGWTDRFPHLNRLEKAKFNVISERLYAESGGMVFAGPFSTMKLSPDLALGGEPAFIVGSYEQEVHGVVNDVIAAAPKLVIDIGAAFGFYAVGFALKIRDTRVVAFEAVEHPHWAQLAELARLNGVAGKITQQGLCTADELRAACQPGAFILSDCEGAEGDLLDPAALPALRSCSLLVELHEFHRPDLVSALVARFRDSHTIRFIEESRRDPEDYRLLKVLPARWRGVAIAEAKWINGSGARLTTRLRFLVLQPR